VSASPIPTVPAAETVPAPPDGAGCVLWHRRNLRTTDHPALAYAAREYDRVMPVFVFDPAFYGPDGLACDARIQVLHESLSSLRRLYEAVGGSLSFAHGDAVEVLGRLHETGWDIVATADPTASYGAERDDRAASRCDVTFVDGDGLIRDQTPTREGWSDRVETWFKADPPAWDPESITFEALEKQVTIEAIEDAYSINPTKSNVPTGGRGPAVRKLRTFVESIGAYPGNISAPTDARTGTSQLSPHLRFGSLSVREVYQYVQETAPDCAGTEMFISRLFWNKHYHQKLEDWSGWMTEAVNPVMQGTREESHDPELVTAWKRGQTGFPMVDASMRCLTETGWLNFRMRAMCASVFADLLQQPWWIGADFYHYHLVDSDPAINYTQWQSQAGTVGTNLMRIYNPIKQARDNDPDGEFIRRYVPELRPLPVEHLDRPEKTPVHVQKESGVVIGDDYPYPVVDYEAARERATEKYERLKPDALAALEDPEIARRASLSSRSQPLEKREAVSEADPSRQASLRSFSASDGNSESTHH
jgi:deoxyribodipyrimidine photo-lyase